VRILVAEDDPTSALILRRSVERLGHECTVRRDGCEAWERYVEDSPDVLITDWMMPGMDGPELVRRIREDGRYCYVLMLSALDDDQHALAGMSAGADGYLTKPLDAVQLKLALIAAGRMTALHRKLEEREAELEALNRRLAVESRRDPLTGVANRLAMREDLERLDETHRRYGRGYALALVDVDHFKAYNDRYGHLVGDEALRRVAEAIGRGLRTVDQVYRYGGEEILVVLPEQTLDAAHQVLERLRLTVETTAIAHEGNPPAGVVTVSAGVAAADEGMGADVQAVLRAADDALYAAKGSGRNRVQAAGAPATA
jgi:diguanylate cyclase (GGDEF)-like protein